MSIYRRGNNYPADSNNDYTWNQEVDVRYLKSVQKTQTIVIEQQFTVQQASIDQNTQNIITTQTTLPLLLTTSFTLPFPHTLTSVITFEDISNSMINSVSSLTLNNSLFTAGSYSLYYSLTWGLTTKTGYRYVRLSYMPDDNSNTWIPFSNQAFQPSPNDELQDTQSLVYGNFSSDVAFRIRVEVQSTSATLANVSAISLLVCPLTLLT
jgi:hypothetical protein